MFIRLTDTGNIFLELEYCHHTCHLEGSTLHVNLVESLNNGKGTGGISIRPIWFMIKLGIDNVRNHIGVLNGS